MHRLDPAVYGATCLTIDHWILKARLSVFNFQIYFESSISFEYQNIFGNWKQITKLLISNGQASGSIYSCVKMMQSMSRRKTIDNEGKEQIFLK